MLIKKIYPLNKLLLLLLLIVYWHCSSPPEPKPIPVKVAEVIPEPEVVAPPSPPQKISIRSIEYDKEKMVIVWEPSRDINFKEYRIFSQADDKKIDTIATISTALDTIYELYLFDPTIQNWFWIDNKNEFNMVTVGDKSTHILEDKAPQATVILPVEYDRVIRFRWTKNKDDDFAHYIVYQSRSLDMENRKSMKLIEGINDTVFILPMDSVFYYQIGVVDHWGLESLSNVIEGDYYINIWEKDYPLLNTTEIDLSSNSIFGVIPEKVGEFVNLEVLRLQNNFLTGTFPNKLWDLKRLRVLNLSNNQLSGSIPNDIFKLKYMEEIWLSNNQFSGPLPYQIFSLNNLTHLNLSSNKISGDLSEAVGNLYSLEYLNLWDNNMVGSIPSEIGQMKKLEFLSLGKNKYSGGIPDEISNATNLVSIAFFENELTGPIPEGITKLPKLRYLGLFNNNLIGSVPDRLMSNLNLDYLRLNDNEFDLIDHDSMCISGYNWENFIYYDVSNNLFEKPLPICFHTEELRDIYVKSFKE